MARVLCASLWMIKEVLAAADEFSRKVLMYHSLTFAETPNQKKEQKGITIVCTCTNQILILIFALSPFTSSTLNFSSSYFNSSTHNRYDQDRERNECQYNQNKGYVVFSAMGSFFIPMSVMLYVYSKICWVLTSRQHRMTNTEVSCWWGFRCMECIYLFLIIVQLVCQITPSA